MGRYLMKKDVILECKKLLNLVIDQQLTLNDLIEKRISHVENMLSMCKKVCFCGKLPWISNIISEVYGIHPDKEINFIDLFEGEGVTQLSEEIKLPEDALYIICSRWHFEEYIDNIGLDKNVIFYPEYLLYLENQIDNSLFSDKYNYSPHMVRETMENVTNNAEDYENLIDILADKQSKELLASIILFRVEFDLKLTRGVKTQEIHYWDKSIYPFNENDVIVDGGGYTGDSLQTFLDGNLKCKEYWLFEPTDAIHQAESVAQQAEFKTHLCKEGLSDKNGTLKFAMRLGTDGELEGVSQVDDDGDSEIEVVRMDKVLNSVPTLIKLDIEGSEIAALEGGKQVFSDRTSFVICAYHKLNDIIEIYNWLKNNGKYDFYMRAERNNLMVDFVIFGIIKIV